MTLELASGFAVVGSGAWLFGRAQPAAVRGTLRRRGLKGFICPDRGVLSRGDLAETASHAERAGLETHTERAETAGFKSHAERAETAGFKSHAERAETAELKTHAESAETARFKSHAESAETAGFKSHAESAETAETLRASDLGSPLRGLEPSGEAASENTQDGALRSLRSLRDNQQPADGPLRSLRSLRDNQQPADGPLRSLRSLRDNQQPADGADGARAWCSASACPFLTRIDCGAPVSAVSDKVLVAPAAARTGARLVKVVPLSFARSLRVTEFASEWVVMATRSRTTRIALADDESLGVRPESAVAWTGERPTGFCPRLRLLDVLLPRGPRDLMLHFHGPAVVWVEGSENLPLRRGVPGKAVF